MKKPSYIAVVGVLLLAGCGNNNQSKTAQGTNSSAGGGKPIEQQGGYIGALGRGENTAIKTIDTASLDQAIQMFNVQEGRNPKNLDELVEKQLIGKVPPAPYGMKLDYDPVAGKVTVVKQ
jgi:hypothetical protein